MFARRLAAVTQAVRNYHYGIQVVPLAREAKPVPAPTDRIKSVHHFLVAIGRKTVEYEEKFADWNALFNASPKYMKNEGIPVKERRYILEQLERFRQNGDVQMIKERKKKKISSYKRVEVLAKLNAKKRIELQKKYDEYLDKQREDQKAVIEAMRKEKEETRRAARQQQREDQEQKQRARRAQQEE